MTPEEWRQRLIETFLSECEPYDSWKDVRQHESAFGGFMEQNQGGHIILATSLEVFLLETLCQLETFVDAVASNAWKWYWLHVLEYTAIFRALRACHILCMNGYPSSSYAMLRDVKDKTLYVAAVANGVTSTQRYLGFQGIGSKPVTDEDYAKVKNQRKSEESRLLNLLVHEAQNFGEHSGEIKRWHKRFNDEVHGSRISGTIYSIDWLVKDGPLPIFPLRNETLIGNYANRLAEVGWMVVRILPLLQPKTEYFDVTWLERWRILEDSFAGHNRYHVDTGAEAMVRLSNAIDRYMEMRLNFDPATHCYVEL